MDMRIPPLGIMIMLESNPLTSRILVRGWAVQAPVLYTGVRKHSEGPSSYTSSLYLLFFFVFLFYCLYIYTSSLYLFLVWELCVRARRPAERATRNQRSRRARAPGARSSSKKKHV